MDNWTCSQINDNLQKKCPEGQFAKKDNWNESRKICKEMIHNDNLQNMLSRRTIRKKDNWDENFKICKK